MGRAPEEVAYLRAVLAASTVAADALLAMERVAELLAPERSAALAAEIETRCGEPLGAARAALAAAPAPADLARFDEIFAAAFRHADECVGFFTSFPRAPAAERIPRILTALHHHAQAQEHFYGIRALLPPFREYWGVDPPLRAGGDAQHEAPEAPSDAAPQGPLFRVGAGGRHGGFSAYVPEQHDAARAWPLIVALHGGSGNGRDFLWTWVRDAKTRGYLVVAPTAVGATWAEEDGAGLLQILDWLGARFHVATDRVLLTGLSDGATFTLVYGLQYRERFRALAPLCGVFHPVNAANGNLERARGVPIYLVHGARDFLFPVTYAHFTRDLLVEAGADLRYRELPELSHTYPRSENAAILAWFEDCCAVARA
ncbi:MAG: phospholipase [Deltaproteobacteria bacterium]|nr:MAG: phospholipase [Deltaproteobacteria bacterium]